MFDGNISPRFPKSHNFQPLPSSKSTGSRASASRRTWQVEVLSYDHTERLPNCYWLYLIVMIVLAFKDGEVYRCDINILFLPQLMSLHQKKHHRTTYDQWPKTEVKKVSQILTQSACVAVDVGEGGCSLISVWKFLKDLSRGEAGHRVINM